VIAQSSVRYDYTKLWDHPSDLLLSQCSEPTFRPDDIHPTASMPARPRRFFFTLSELPRAIVAQSEWLE
jgi:hypothetical protein